MTMTFEEFSQGQPIKVTSSDGTERWVNVGATNTPQKTNAPQQPQLPAEPDLLDRLENRVDRYNFTEKQDITPPEEYLRKAGQVAGGIIDVGEAAVTGLAKAVDNKFMNVPSSILKAGAETSLGKKVVGGVTDVAEGVARGYSDFKSKNPRAAENFEAAANIAGVLPVGELLAPVVKSTVKSTVPSIKRAADSMITDIEGAVKTATTPSPEKAIQNTYDGIMGTVENSKALLKEFRKSEGAGRDPIRVISENPDYAITINPEARSIDAKPAIANLNRDIAEFSEVRDAVLKTADETLPPLEVKNIIERTSERLTSKDYRKYLDEGVRAVGEIETKLASLRSLYGRSISRFELNEVRKGLDDTINKFTDNNLKDKLRADLRTVFKETLEEGVPEKGLLKKVNTQIGELIDTENFLAKKLDGAKVKGGSLTGLVARATGATIGATGLGGTFGGLFGAATGYLLSDFVFKQLIKNAINNPFDRAVLEKLKQARPDIIKQAEEYSKTSRAQYPQGSRNEPQSQGSQPVLRLGGQSALSYGDSIAQPDNLSRAKASNLDLSGSKLAGLSEGLKSELDMKYPELAKDIARVTKKKEVENPPGGTKNLNTKKP